MTLAEWQDELVGLLTGAVDTDRNGIANTPGFRLTVQVQLEWRAFRIRNSLPLTCRLLGPTLAAELEHYLCAVPEPCSFFLREAEQFAAHCAGRRSGADPHVAAVIRFELAMLRGVQARADLASQEPTVPPRGSDLVGIRHGADIVAFAAPPELVLAAVATGAPPPAPRGRHLLLCTPSTCRRATPDEAAAFAAARRGPRPAGTFTSDVLRSLSDAGAFVFTQLGLLPDLGPAAALRAASSRR